MNHKPNAAGVPFSPGAESTQGLWRVSIGGGVKEMTPVQIAIAFEEGELTLRTPLWPPGATGWNALGDFSELQNGPSQSGRFPNGYDVSPRLTGSVGTPSAPGPTHIVAATTEVIFQESTAHTGSYFSARPTQRVRPRQPAQSPVKATALGLAPTIHRRDMNPVPIPSEIPEFRRNRRGWWIAAGFAGVMGLTGVALHAERDVAAKQRLVMSRVEEKAASPVPPPTPSAAAVLIAPEPTTALATLTSTAAPSALAAPTALAAPAASALEVQPSGATPSASADAVQTAPGTGKPIDPAGPGKSATADDVSAATPAKAAKVELAKKRHTKQWARPEKWSKASKAPPVSRRRAMAPEPSPVEQPLTASVAEPTEPSATPEAQAVVPKAEALKALTKAAELAKSCRPKGGPFGAGDVRIIYSPDGSVRSVEILTPEFRETTTGNCVRMVFRRAKIDPFQGAPATFLKGFTIPE